MRVTKTAMVEKEVTTYSCDVCGFSTEYNHGCCGSSTIMKCYFCGQDCCHDHRKSFWENDWNDYPDMTICSTCLPKGQKAWDLALDTAKRYESISSVAKEIFENFEKYEHLLEDDDDDDD